VPAQTDIAAPKTSAKKTILGEGRGRNKKLRSDHPPEHNMVYTIYLIDRNTSSKNNWKNYRIPGKIGAGEKLLRRFKRPFYQVLAA